MLPIALDFSCGIHQPHVNGQLRLGSPENNELSGCLPNAAGKSVFWSKVLCIWSDSGLLDISKLEWFCIIYNKIQYSQNCLHPKTLIANRHIDPEPVIQIQVNQRNQFIPPIYALNFWWQSDELPEQPPKQEFSKTAS